jgi:prepilin-type N-terminal cleavage/methylation domain-containing protein
MKRSRGFTLVELMIVIAVIAILATLALTGFRTAQASARDTQRQQNVKGVQVALECYYSENGQYPDGIADWNTLASIGDCWSGAATGLHDIPVGDTVAADGTITRGTWTGSYGYVSDGDSYTVTLTGETKTLTFNSPS